MDVEALRGAPPPTLPPRRLLILSRVDSDKLLSIGAALRAIEAYAALAPDGIEVRVSGGGDAVQQVRQQARRLEERGIGVGFRGPTARPHEEIAWADAVFGIGRVALEGLAAGRPVVICGAQGNLAGLCGPDNIDHWFESNLNGRNTGAQAPAEVARALAAVSREQLDRLAGWTAEHAGTKQLVRWAELLEAASRRRPGPEQIAFGESLGALLTDHLNAVGTLDALRAENRTARSEVETARAEAEKARAEADQARGEAARARAHAAEMTAAAELFEESFYRFMEAARQGLKQWPPRPVRQARALWTAARVLLPGVRDAIDGLHRVSRRYGSG